MNLAGFANLQCGNNVLTLFQHCIGWECCLNFFLNYSEEVQSTLFLLELTRIVHDLVLILLPVWPQPVQGDVAHGGPSHVRATVAGTTFIQNKAISHKKYLFKYTRMRCQSPSCRPGR